MSSSVNKRRRRRAYLMGRRAATGRNKYPKCGLLNPLLRALWERGRRYQQDNPTESVPRIPPRRATVTA